MKCIKCGQELTADLIPNPEFGLPLIIGGYICLNCNLKWSLAEHKDNQNWAIRHIRALEARVLILEQSLDSLLKKLGV